MAMLDFGDNLGACNYCTWLVAYIDTTHIDVHLYHHHIEPYSEYIHDY